MASVASCSFNPGLVYCSSSALLVPDVFLTSFSKKHFHSTLFVVVLYLMNLTAQKTYRANSSAPCGWCFLFPVSLSYSEANLF